MAVTGGCICGGVRYTAELNNAAKAVCHCKPCQRRTASAFSVNVIIPRSAFKITQGITRSYPHLGDSGKLYHSHFCGNCGASTHGVPDASTSVLAIKAGSLDSEFVDLGTMDSEFYVVDRLGYLKALEGVKQHDGMM
ncbi:hypothetical protein CGCSCA1_v000594 [Colletotrichum siamense]|nr:hypothetical protein CGCSCA1_v000594 [Colletotrichum siamense]